MKRYQLSEKEATKILEDILEHCELEQNTLSLKTLISYSDYRKERNAFQKRILRIIMILFVVLPFLFLGLTMNVSKRESRYLTLYDLKVKTYFPIEKISATIDDTPMAIYETSDKNYVIKVTKNGTMHVKVQLWNRQYEEQQIVIDDCDETPPALLSYKKEGNLIYLYVSDDQTGIKYDSAYALLEDGSKEKPIEIQENCFVFKQSNSTVYILDHAGNRLKIKLN